jgi:hypothetical protein
VNAAQTIVVVVFWFALIGLAGLILLLFRQVERAYRHTADVHQAGLLPGVEAPDIEVLVGSRIVPLGFPEDQHHVLAFVNGDCDICAELLKELAVGGVFDGPIEALLMDASGPPIDPASLPARISIHAVAHPPDIRRSYGVSVTPFVYFMNGKTVLSARSVWTAAGLSKLVDEAQSADRELRVALGRNGYSADPTPMSSGVQSP